MGARSTSHRLAIFRVPPRKHPADQTCHATRAPADSRPPREQLPGAPLRVGFADSARMEQMLNRRDFLKGAGASLGGHAFGAAADRPNVVQILIDDMGFADLGCYG